MNRDLRLFLLAVGIPALLMACAGIRLVQLEMQRAARVAALERLEAERQEKKARAAQEQARNDAERPPRKPRAGKDQQKPLSGQQKPSAGPQKPPAGNPPRRAQQRKDRPPVPRGPNMMRVFTEAEDSVASERVMWIGGCVVGLLFISLVSGGWLLVKSARRAREEAMRKTDFVSNVSHEFKTPLTTICLCAELAQDDGLDPARRKKALASIQSEAERLKGLVLAALDFSRLERRRREFHIEECDVAEIVREAAEPLEERFAANGLALPGPDASAFALADAAAVRQIVVALLDNAAKYAAGGGPVEVSVATSRGRSSVSLSVADRGPGMDRADMRRAFDRFWRGDNATTSETGGSGLGLAIVRELAKGMKGDASVSQREGGGLVFEVRLPAAREGSGAA